MKTDYQADQPSNFMVASCKNVYSQNTYYILGFFVITIVGAGKVGSAAALDILKNRISDVVLIDLNADLAKGEALIMMQAASTIEFDGTIIGTNDF